MSSLRVLQVNTSDLWGGAARATYRIHHAMRRQGVDSIMCVDQASAGDWTVQVPTGKWIKAPCKLRPNLGRLFTNLLKTCNPNIHSPAIIPSHWPKRLVEMKADLLHLHWVNDEMMSIADIGRLHIPVVWTLHDMWAFCGAEHYTEDFRWRDGYTRNNRPSHESGFDLNCWTWKRKRRRWKRPMYIVTPSRWLAECVSESALMRDWPVQVIPNTMDTTLYRPHNKVWCRDVLGLPGDIPLILFGAIGGTRDLRKGFDLLVNAMRHLSDTSAFKEAHCVVFGQKEPKDPPQLGLPIHWMGHLSDEWSLVLLYNAADVMVVPSRQENLPQSGSEAQACGTPVVAFNCTGLPDVVDHKSTGYLAEPYSSEDLAEGIRWVLSDAARYRGMSQRAREVAVARYSPSTVIKQYLAVYKRAMSDVSY